MGGFGQQLVVRNWVVLLDLRGNCFVVDRYCAHGFQDTIHITAE